MTQIDDLPELPPDLYSPPERIGVSLPVSPRPLALPLDELNWEAFERLCLRVAAQDPDARHAKLYGRRGQKQHGIDIYVRCASGKYHVWQAKRYQDYTANDVRNAVEEFKKGKWIKDAATFTLCVKASLQDTKIQDEIEHQARELRAIGIELLALDGDGLSQRLKEYPEIVDDFFGREWVAAYCGAELTSRLADRLPATEAQELRQELRKLYRCHFQVWDSGAQLPAPSHEGFARQLPLIERYVEADVFETSVITTTVGNDPPQGAFAPAEGPNGHESDRRASGGPRGAKEYLKRRIPALSWLARQDRCIVLGDAGSGKSTLLRVLALEILAEKPRHATIQARWAGYLPIWLPFSFWTSCVASDREHRALGATLRRYFQELEAPERLTLLVEQALRDRRLLLLIDGLDEWSNEQAGRTAVSLLRSFAERYEVTTIVTSRPMGFQRLSNFDDRWEKADLAPLSQPQQQALVYRWFAHLEDANPSLADAPTPSTAKSRADAFVTELNRHTALSPLAGIPLLLWGLTALRLSQARLPRNRFAAYERLTDLLLHEHPDKRREAALARSRGDGLSADTQDEALACLAFSALEHGEEVALELARARETLADFLIERLDYPRYECVRSSEALLDVSADAAGVLVPKSSRHLGFVHRTFMEFLAARHVVQLDLDEQRALFRARRHDPQWFDALLAVLYLTRRPNDVATLVAEIEDATTDQSSEPLRQRLLAEISFGAFALPPKIAKRLADSAFSEIERGTWMPLRRELLSLAVDGLQSDSLRTPVQARIRRWFPDRHPYRSSIYEAVATWPPAPETLDCLWEGMLGCTDWNRKAAAVALAKAFAGDDDVECQLKRLLRTPAEPDLHVAALDALSLGWPDAEGTERAIADADSSIIPDLRLIAIRARVAAGSRTLEDRDALLALAVGGSDLSFHRRDELADTLVAGWPGDETVRDRCLDSRADRFGGYREQIDHDVGSRVLLTGYPSDPLVIESLAEQFERDEYLTFLHNAEPLLPNIFPNASVRLQAAIEKWIQKERYSENRIAYASLAIRTDLAKGVLLGGLQERNRFQHWSVYALLEGWGMRDPDVAQELTRIARASGIEVLPSAPRICDILLDRAECRQRLLDLVRHPETQQDFHLVALGLKRLGIAEGDDELKNVLLARDHGGPTRWWSSALPLLMQSFPNDARVREFAKQELVSSEGDDFLFVVAGAYAHDAQMREEIRDCLSPLPGELRQTLVERLKVIAQDDLFATEQLSQYDDDCIGAVKANAAIGYYESVLANRAVTDGTIETLREGLHAVGSDCEERRQAAFAGLLTLDRLDVFLGEKERRRDEGLKLRLWQGWRDNSTLLRLVARHWDRLQSSFTDDDWARLEGIGGYGSTRFGGLAPYATEGSLLEKETVREIEDAEDKPMSGGLLAMFARIRPSSEKLKRLCLCSIEGFYNRPGLPTLDDGISSARLLASHFSDDIELLGRLESLFRDSGYTNELAAIALCAGWPRAASLAEAMEQYRKEKRRLQIATYFHLICDQLGSERFAEVSIDTIANLSGSAWKLHAHCAPPIVRRLRHDSEAGDRYLEHLLGSPTPNTKASLPGLLVAAHGLTEKLRSWCDAELEGQCRRQGIAQHGVDLSAGSVRSVGHVLIGLLDGGTGHEYRSLAALGS